MYAEIEVASHRYSVDLAHPLDLSIPLDFHGEQPAAFHLPRAESRAAEVGNFVGDTTRGGSCNCETVTFSPHGAGTHTEAVGHLTEARVAVRDCLGPALIPCAVVSVAPETVSVSRFREDQVIVCKALETVLACVPRDWCQALVIRTLPNDEVKRFQSYSNTNPPYLAGDAMEAVVAAGVEHLLVDLPSVDRERDEGLMASHRVFFGLEPGVRSLPPGLPPPRRTITEMIFVPNAVRDGQYLLNLQVAPFVLDAAPSRPVLFAVVEVGAARRA